MTANTPHSDTRISQRLAQLGIQSEYRGMDGRMCRPPETTLHDLMRALDDGDELPVAPTMLEAPKDVRCYRPAREDRVWGVAAQLFQLRSSRNWGIGDFADLERLAQIMGAAGADFIGLNPLHALFLSDPAQCSPFSPSDRRVLNPLYIAVDRVEGFDPEMIREDELEDLRNADLVDYTGVAAAKLRVLRMIWQKQGTPDASPEFRHDSGPALDTYALFEAMSAQMVAEGRNADWQDWGEEAQHPHSAQMTAFAGGHAADLAFYRWLQWQADRQLQNARAACKSAGMSIGLYLDFAVGEMPGGAGSWGRRDVLATARIGAPPDQFSAVGQDWGLAPLSPITMRRDGADAFRKMMLGAMRQAGAIRIDHALALWQLFLIPKGASAAEGTYVRYPIHDMLKALAEASNANQTIVVGEDLGNVPEGFRDVMQAAGILSYRILFFEQDDDGFIPPDRYPVDALACLSTHDMPTFPGWRQGSDIRLRAGAGLITAAHMDTQLAERTVEYDRLVDDLQRAGILGESYEADDLVAAAHMHLARAPCRLFAVRLEDLTGAPDPVNVPGTSTEYPNWRTKIPLDLDAIEKFPLFETITAALRKERPSSG